MTGLLTRFGLAGLVNTLAGYCVIFAMLASGAGDLTANAAGYGFGLVLSFVLNRSYVFGSSDALSSREVTRYLGAFAIAYLANVGVLWMAKIPLGAGNPVAQLPAIATYSIIQFILFRRYVFLQRP